MSIEYELNLIPLVFASPAPVPSWRVLVHQQISQLNPIPVYGQMTSQQLTRSGDATSLQEIRLEFQSLEEDYYL